jgi:deoxyribodipyrimidine photo-lyase
MTLSASTPPLRLRALSDAPVHPDRDYVLYWMTAFRRVRDNFALDRAVDRARELDRPLLILEALRCDYPWASDRLHAFVLDGMRVNRAALAEAPVRYYPYVERARGEGKGLLAALASRACVVIGDDDPAFFLPRMLAKAAASIDVRLEVVDSNGLLPLRAADQVFTTAFSFRRFLQKALPEHLGVRPRRRQAWTGLRAPPSIPRSVRARWPEGIPDLAELPIDHHVAPVALEGGERAARERIREFVRARLDRYADARNHPDADASSGLSPYLHFGHASPHHILAEIAERERWDPSRVAERGRGQRAGWWGMSEPAEAFLDELVTWRELGYNMAWQRRDTERYESLPAWARETIDAHRGDPRPHLYTLRQLERAATGDEIWNASQRQLLREGRIHNYLRMLWGKKIFEWSETPERALEVMIELNNKYGVDGRDPNSTSGIFWCLGRYDRAWGPERPIFGKIRYMTSESARRKLRLARYLERFGA